MSERAQITCPVEQAGNLEGRLRSWLQNPQKILAPYIKPGMTVLDLGCGPGFFTIPLAEMVGESGRVIAVDLQEGMLQKLKDKIRGKEIAERIQLHKCEEDKIGISEMVDFILAIYIVHEVSNQEKLFKEMRSVLKENGRLLMVEPPFHVSKRAFKESTDLAGKIGFTAAEKPKVFMSKAIIFKKN